MSVEIPNQVKFYYSRLKLLHNRVSKPWADYKKKVYDIDHPDITNKSEALARNLGVRKIRSLHKALASCMREHARVNLPQSGVEETMIYHQYLLKAYNADRDLQSKLWRGQNSTVNLFACNACCQTAVNLCYPHANLADGVWEGN